MPDKTEEVKEVVTPDGTEKNYLEAIEKLKANSVNRDEYEKVLAENKQLLESIVNGTAESEKGSEREEETIDLDELRNSLFNEENTNLEYATKALKLRQELIKRGETDPFLPYGQKILPTDEDIAAADRVAKALEDCVEYAQGDSDIFTTELQRIMVDSAPRKRR